jgi:3'-5' exonuclease
MIDHIKLRNVLFLDIETVPLFPNYASVPEHMKQLWNHKSTFLSKEPIEPELLYERAGIYAEFGKIICISIGSIEDENGFRSFRVKSFYGDDEKELLEKFTSFLQKHFNKPNQLLCAHNGKEFDFPYMSRRILINGLKLPAILQISGKKPWEVSHLDTLELWKFGDYKHYSSLTLLAAIFDIPTPKDDISGKDVYKVYYQEKDLNRIVEYCQKDVLTVAQIFLKYRCEDLIKDENVFVVKDLF